MKKLKYLLFSIIPILFFTSKVNALSIEMYQDQQMSALGYKECVLSRCWDRYRNVKYNGQLASLNFYSPLTISPLNKYTLTINFIGDDFISAKANTVSVNNNTECSIISTQTDGNDYSRYLKIAFVCGQSSDWFHVNLGGLGDDGYITGGPSSGNTTYGISSLDIINETASETDKIIAGNDKNTDNIINNNNNNTNNIIDNNNQNTDKIIESNKENFNTCRDSVNLFNKDSPNIIKYKYLNVNGDLVSDGPFSISDYIIVKPNTDYSLQPYSQLSASLCFYDKDKNIISCLKLYSINSNFKTPDNTVYIRSSFLTKYLSTFQIQEGTFVTDYEPFGKKICINKLDEQNKTSKGILGKLTSLFDWLTNKDSADVSGANKIAGYLPPGPLDSIINLPLTFFQNLNTNLSKTCTPLDVPIPYINKTIQIPCVNNIFNQIDGLPNLWNWVGTIMSIFILYRYLIALYKYYDDLTTLKANFISDWGSI